MNNSAPAKCSSYHHGDLHQALIIAAAELIEERGLTGFAMIDAARRAGVSSGAPYRHFKDKEALLEAVCQVAFMALTEQINATISKFEPGSAASIIALGQTYVHFVTSHPQFYDLMWGEHGLRDLESGHADLRASSFYTLANAVGSWCQRKGIEDKDPEDLAVKLWALGHGIGGLALYNHLDKFMPAADVNQLIETSTHTFLEGLSRN
ncbi:MAG: TetR/AcrR family transcriptional regulator [Halieaceae bacterium]|jgi:AcrR family transcriptional regulator|nr:TetR/AcrR family transcriptional regulator [Halieaceae bacterium]